MKIKQLFVLFLCVSSILCTAQSYSPVARSSQVKFYINQLGFTTWGTFGGITGDINFNASYPKYSSFEMSVSAETVFTENRKRDNHLKSADYFYVEKYPLIYIISKSISSSGQEGNFQFNGVIIIKGISKEISFPFKAIPEKSGYLFKGSFELNRKDFLVGEVNPFLSNKVTVDLSVSTIKK
jgi:polyisoprenoid-binding protein YceI